MANGGRKFKALAKLILAVLTAGGLVAAVGLPFVGALGLTAKNVADGFNNEDCDVDLSKRPAQKSVIKTATGEPITFFFEQNRDLVEFKQIPTVMRQAIVSIEDRRFYEHKGVDVQGLMRVMLRNGTSGEVQGGASTLTQQLVKNTLLYSAKTEAEQEAAVEQSLGRKLREARCALAVEQKMSKDDILAGYLNIANFGGGSYGVGTAAKTYFNKDVSKLTLPEAALLAGLVQSPTRYDPFRHPEAAKNRREQVLDAMQRDGYITRAAADKARSSAVLAKGAKRPQVAQGCINAKGDNVGFFCDYVTWYLVNKQGWTEEQLARGGYTIQTTFDPEIQASAQASVTSHMEGATKSVAVMDVIEPETGKVRAMAASVPYGTGPGQRVDNLTFRPTNAGSGSTYKLFTLIAALKRKIPLRAFSLDTPNEYEYQNCPQISGKHTVQNAGNYGVTQNLETATFKSANTFFAHLIDDQFSCDMSEIVDTAVSLGMDDLAPRRDYWTDKPSFTLGPNENGTGNPLQLAVAYGVVANKGILCASTPIEKITDANGKDVPLKETGCKRVLDEGIANTVINVLAKDTQPGTGGTAPRAHIPGYATAGKTGTTQGNAAVWFVGLTPRLTASVGIFNPAKPSDHLTDVPGFENRASELFGGRLPAPIWHDAIAPILQARFPQNVPWPKEDEAVVNGNSVPVPSVVGMDLNTATGALESRGFRVQVGDPKDSDQPKDFVAEQSPSGRAMPGQTITLHLSTGNRPPGEGGGPGNGGGGPGNGGGDGGGGGGGRGGGNGGGDDGGRNGGPPIIINPPIGGGGG